MSIWVYGVSEEEKEQESKEERVSKRASVRDRHRVYACLFVRERLKKNKGEEERKYVATSSL